MGEVRRCQDSLLDRSVALKVVRRDADIDDFETRFLREARVQARLAHPGVVPVYDVGRDDNGRVYFTMKRVEGVTMEDVILALRSGAPLPGGAQGGHYGDRRQLLTAFARACLTVDYAHSRGVLHRDLKPANLMLGAYGEVYVLDWGLAKIQDVDDAVGDITITPARNERETECGVAMGTPAYMSPEQALARPLDARADVFALGAILYEILTLDPLLDEHAIRRIRARQRLQIHPRTGHEELDAIVFRATAFDAHDRYPSARALHDAVEHFLTADEELRVRQRRAAQHVERAQALSHDDATRSAALEELGAALALVPEDDAARAHLVHLLRTPPKATPHEVTQRRLEHEVTRLRQVQAAVAGLYLVAWVLAYPALVYFGGVEDTLGAVVAPAMWVFAALVIGVQYWTKSHHSPVSWSGVAGAAALAATSLVWGPLFIVPGLAIVLLFGQLLVAQKRQRAHVVFLFGAAVAVPSYLALRGYWDVYMPAGADMFAIHGSVGVTRVVFYAGLLVAHLAQTLFGARFAARYRDALDRRVLENALFSWQLANLVPRGGSAVHERRSRPSLLAESDFSISRSRSSESDFDPARFQVDGDVPDAHRYMRLAHIGQTRHTDVWRCLDRRLGRPVDMHVAKSPHDDVATLAEARATGRLEHPAVAPVYDVGTNEHGRVYYTIKNVRGVPLAHALETVTNDRAYRRTLAAFQQVCLAVAYAHERGVYHRSLDLSSIVLGGFGEVYVGGWSAKPFESIRERQLDVRALKHILGHILELYRAEIPGVPRAATPRELHDLVEAFLSGTRDEEALHDLAQGHLERAKEAAAHAFGGVTFDVEAEARVVALREVGRAVRLDPKNQDAIRLLFRLITEPPSKAPPTVRQEVERLREQRSRGPARSSAVFGAVWLIIYPVIAHLLGIRSLTSVVVIWSAWALAEIALLYTVFKRPKNAIPWPMLSTMFAGIVTASLMGPFFFTPIIAAFATMSFVLVVPRGWRTATMFLGSLIVLIPVVLGASGAYSAGDVVGNVVLSSSTLSATSHETSLLILTAMHLLGLLFAAEYASRFRDRLDTVEQAYLLRAWQLKKLVRA